MTAATTRKTYASMAAGGMVRVRRVYEEREPGDGTRVLVDRIWPRGLTKAKAALDEWCKDVAPSDELRTWYRQPQISQAAVLAGLLRS